MVMPAGESAPRPDPGVRPPHDPDASKVKAFAEYLGQTFGTAPPQPATPADAPKAVPAPKDSAQFIATFASSALTSSRARAALQACGCVQCRLAVFEAVVSEYVCGQVVAAAHTGDTSKLQAIADLIAAQKARP